VFHSAVVQAAPLYCQGVGALSRPATVLLVEDDAAVAAMLRRHLARAGMIVYEATTQRDAVRRAAETAPDVVLLDLVLTEGAGAEVCRQVRASEPTSEVPIIVLTARGELASKAELFALGADDYVVKPFDPAEILLRIEALLRRRAQARSMRRVGPLTVAVRTGDAWMNGEPIELTAGERGVLAELARAWPALAPREALAHAPWREDRRTSENVVEALVGRIRRKIQAAGGGVEIRTVRRSGYLLALSATGRAEREPQYGKEHMS